MMKAKQPAAAAAAALTLGYEKVKAGDRKGITT